MISRLIVNRCKFFHFRHIKPSFRGGWENSAVFLQKTEASPTALLVQSRAQQKSFLLLLEEKIRRAHIRKSKENFFVGWRVVARGGGAGQFSRSKRFAQSV